MSVSTGKRARLTGRGGRRVVLAGRGDGWQLWVPEDVWAAMSEAERAAYVERQRALLDQAARASTLAEIRHEKKAPTSTERRPRRAIAGALDLAGALQLTLL